MNSDEFISDLLRNQNFVLTASDLDESAAVLKIVSYLRCLQSKETKIISLIGGAASGKSTLARKIAGGLKSANIIGTDDFVLGTRKFRREHMESEGKNPLMKYDFELLREKAEKIKTLQFGELVCLPLYQNRSGTGLQIEYDEKSGQIIEINRDVCDRKIGRADFLLVEGDFQALTSPDYQIYLHISDDVRLRNRINRDLSERGSIAPAEIIENFDLRQKSQHLPYTLTYDRRADLLLLADAAEFNLGYKYKYSFWAKPNIAVTKRKVSVSYHRGN